MRLIGTLIPEPSVRVMSETPAKRSSETPTLPIYTPIDLSNYVIKDELEVQLALRDREIDYLK